jgi:hypothetical protein
LRTVTVREAAQALNLTKRAIMYRLESKKLKGIRVRNDFGVEEWRIYPTKEIAERLSDVSRTTATVEAKEVADEFFEADDVDFEEADVQTAEHSDLDSDRERMKVLADEFVRPLLEKLDAQTRALTLREQEVEDLRIKLLPDLQKRAEEERKVAELKELEIVALKNQIAAMKDEADKEIAAAKEQVESLMEQLNGPQKKESWFKKWFLPRGE